ncbi:MAG: 3-oxoacyl-ACP reductase FabG [Proteobacteria bacterium]|nr:3-oxoacyl-ACP reductase FabG [Pseudomonadota bacterium]
MKITTPQLGGKVALVTGGSRGIGRAIVETLAADGADVTFFYRGNDEAARDTIAAVAAAGGNATAVKVDVTDAAACSAAVEALYERTEAIDILVNNAGVTRDNVLTGMTDAELADVLATNVSGVFNMTRAVAPFMVSRRRGTIVNLSSVSAQKGGRGQTNYAASKGAIESFTKALAVELAARRIRVNCVAPGVIETEMSEAVRDAAGDEVKSRILLRRFGQPQDVANVVWFLATPLADYMTGQVVHVDGGFKME